MNKSKKIIILFLALLVISYAVVYMYLILTPYFSGLDIPVELQHQVEIKPEASLQILVREKDFLLKYKTKEEIVTSTKEIKNYYNKLTESAPELTVIYEADKDLEFLRVMIPFSDLNEIPPGKIKIINK